MVNLAIRFAILSIIIVLSACSSISDATNGKRIAEQQVVRFHELFNDENYDEIIKTINPKALDENPANKWIELLNVVRRKLGKSTESVQVTWNVGSFNLQTRVTLVQNTKFESGSGSETFVYTITDNKAQMYGYHINSNDLILK